MNSTINPVMKPTICIFDLRSFQPISDTSFKDPQITTQSILLGEFKPRYKISDNQLIELPYVSIDNIELANSLFEIGTILLKDSRNETPVELAAMRSYFKTKYKKIQR